jgi:hypothetical protein
MSRNKKPKNPRRNDNPQPIEAMSIPISLSGLLARMLPPEAITVSQVVEALTDGPADGSRTWYVQTGAKCCDHPTARDGIIITSMTAESVAEEYRDKRNPRFLKISIVNEHSGQFIVGAYDLDTLRNFVNRLSEAIDYEARR